MTHEFTVNTDAVSRTVQYKDNEDTEFIDVEITPKEAVDLLHALDEFTLAASEGRLDTDLPVDEMLNITRGGLHFPDECTVLIPSETHAEVVIHALVRHEPDDIDLTGRLKTLMLATFDESPLEVDIDALRTIQ